MADQSNDPEGYKIGYGRPPKTSQFKPGQSGNQRGRPKGSRSFGQILREVMGGKVSITENGRTRRGLAVEGIVARLRNDALRGEKLSVRDALTLCERYLDFGHGAARLEDLLQEDQEILKRCAAEMQASSNAKGLEQPRDTLDPTEGIEGDAPRADINLSELLSEDAAIVAQARRDELLPELKAEETPNPGHDDEAGDDEEGGDGGPV